MLTDHNAPAPPPQQWSVKKITLWLAGLLLIFIIAILAYDEKLEPYDDLKPLRTTTPDSRTNGYLLLKERWGKLPEGEKSDRDKLKDMVSGKIPWDETLVSKRRIGRENMTSDLKAALALPEYLIPPVLTLNDPAFTGIDWMRSPFMHLAMEVLASARAGNSAAALGLLGDLRSLASRHIIGSGSLLSLLVGVSLHSVTANLTGELLGLGKMEPSQMEALAETWKNDLPAAEAWRVALRSETAFSGDVLLAVANKRPGLHESFQAKHAWLLLKKNKTHNRMHQKLRHAGQIAFKTFPSKSEAESAGWGQTEDKRSKLERYLDTNYVGNKLTEGDDLIGRILPGVTNKLLFEPRAVRVGIAIQRWRASHPDQWPASLEELVPGFLTSVPKDPFNGNPLLWDEASQIIYCVGSDWKDDLPTFEDHSSWFALETESPGLRLSRPPAPPPVPQPQEVPKKAKSASAPAAPASAK